MSERHRFELIIEDAASPGEPPVVIRLRRLVKNMLRAHSFRVRTLRPFPDGRPLPEPFEEARPGGEGGTEEGGSDEGS
jgi:hypothetical protein